MQKQIHCNVLFTAVKVCVCQINNRIYFDTFILFCFVLFFLERESMSVLGGGEDQERE